MTFNQIVQRVLDRMNLTSDKAYNRVLDTVNEVYKEVVSGVGLETSVLIPAVTANTVVSSRYVTFTGVTKILAVFDPSVTPARVLFEKSFDELRNEPDGGSPPVEYAIQNMGANSVTIYLNGTPTTSFPLQADCEGQVSLLTGNAQPNFNEDFHDILIKGAMAVEYHKMEKSDKGKVFDDKYEKRLSELRLYIASSAYNDIVQGKTAYDIGANWNPLVH